MTDLSFDGNWLLETSTFDTGRAQLVYINHFFGEISVLSTIKVTNQIGMNNPYVTAFTSDASSLSSSIIKKASMYPLIKWDASADKVVFKPLLTTAGSYFTNIYYQHVTSNANTDYLFWPALTSTASVYIADTLTFVGVTMDNI